MCINSRIAKYIMASPYNGLQYNYNFFKGSPDTYNSIAESHIRLSEKPDP